ncbi:MAG TPA: T9SS type A sorting domain-containing protein, partial [Candidatus Krumholzibacteria bacterium]
PNYWGDDATGLERVAVNLGAHGTRTVTFPYWKDADGDGGAATGHCGFVLLDHTVDPTGVSAPDSVALRTWVVTSGTGAYEDGGDPTNDFERYALLSSGEIESPAGPGDLRAVMAVGPFPAVAPGQTIAFTVALVVTPGDFSNVARAVEAYDGRWFDLDHNPATGVDGKEHREPWYLPTDVMAPVWLAGVAVGPYGADVRVRWGIAGDQALQSIDVLRAPAAGGEASVVATLPGNAREYVDKSATPGARYAYTIMIHGVYGASYASPALETTAPNLPTTFWQSYPNPFRGTTTISAYLRERANVSLAVFDAAGRRVRSLVSGVRDEGDTVVSWDGTDDAGRRLPSGVYFAKLEVGGQTLSQKLLIMR